MDAINEARSMGRRFWFYALVFAAILLLIGLSGVSMVSAEGGGPCYGTYLVDLDQSVGIWTLSKDGSVLVTDSAEQFIGFSHEQGAWTHTVERQARATFIDLTFDPNGPLPAGYARIDANLAFADGCDSLDGTLDIRVYGESGDPLDPTGGFQIADDIPFTGRRINP